jgi:hypothetical protein
METQQMMEFLLARMDANTNANPEDLLARMEAKIDANREAVREEMIKANQEKAYADREHLQQMMDGNKERMNASLREEIQSGQAEMRSTVSAMKEKMKVAIHSLRACRKKTTADRKATQANPEKMETSRNNAVCMGVSRGPEGRRRSENF